MERDIASQMVDGVDRFLMKQVERAAAGREQFWKRDFSSADAYDKSIAENRARLGQILGVRDARPARVEMELVASVDRPALVGKSAAFEAYAVRWRAFGDVHGEGLLLKPIGREPIADVIAISDADQTPEMIAGLDATTAPEQKFARHLVESGCRVIVPALLNRKLQTRSPSGRTGGPELSNREFVYRSAFELGRHVLGYEVEKVLAAVDWSRRENPTRPVAVFGYGEGGMLALFAAALDTRIELTGVAGYFNAVEATFEQPIERNVFGLNQRFGDAELALMVWPRRLVIEDAWGPEVKVRGRGAAPGQLTGQLRGWDELERAASLADPTRKTDKLTIGMVVQKNFPFGREAALKMFLEHFHATLKTAPEPKVLVEDRDPAERQFRQLHELDRHNQQLLAASAGTRREFMKKLDTSSLEKYEQSTRAYRDTFYNDVLGRFDQPLLPLNPRTRRIYDTDKFAGYEVALDVFPDVIAYGILLLPKDLKEGEKRPLVVCQHGLEGRPQETITGDSKYYHDFAAKLAERGFITFSPQNLYIFGDRFRVLGRKANPLGKTIWSIIIPQHQQILNFLKTLPNVDAKRIGFYGLSYGGKTAMRVPAVLTDYCLSICSGDFNEWVVKNASTALPMSYVFSPEYEIFEWDLGSTFNYAEMAALIAPRPFMVERGHFDGVSTDEYVAFEFAKVRRLYSGQLKIGERCEIEFFDGPHTINGKGTFEFLHKHLNWEKR
ncbi:MAG: dap4 1 [Phycisphaerales bacterium]|nr:dap4 1 [Phycisphaerales bacterium]